MMPLSPDLSGTAPRNLVIWHTEGTAISGLLSWMYLQQPDYPAHLRAYLQTLNVPALAC